MKFFKIPDKMQSDGAGNKVLFFSTHCYISRKCNMPWVKGQKASEWG